MPNHENKSGPCSWTLRLGFSLLLTIGVLGGRYIGRETGREQMRHAVANFLEQETQAEIAKYPYCLVPENEESGGAYFYLNREEHRNAMIYYLRNKPVSEIINRFGSNSENKR